ncbi:1-propanol dehydrogenase PduQ [Lachnoclostridium phytofermentans]|uniref:Iron-containing alcohol dehydrogenase n=1 Tax=Lachnoclostridium phytofermentans (strain ATCC 700394 / DSM 18823 / ISDg) TaxID=357809 RepID=A9KPD4_LACP7|nr:1-propanol dehydrogenase PduQ [Lachnoclostridium phytofermentans]ABX41796.1 iron-containing alcohol dehydrogenase [Lachnoclostridium phytofermentans ISDg]
MEQFVMNTKIYMGSSCLDKMKDLPAKKAYIICDPFMAQSGKVNLITDILIEMGSSFEVFSEVVPDPTIQVVSKAIGGMNSFKPDTVIALGGGSAIDTAKAASNIYSQMGNEKLFLIAIPTTSGTGSEVTNFSVISDPQAQAKYPLRSDSMVPDAAFLDPRFTVSVPPQITADTGMDVLTHALEAYVSTNAGDFTDACAEKAVRLVWNYLARTVEEGSDMEARTHMHNASCLAGVAFNGASLGLCHSMAHALGARFHIPHGRSNAILLPHIISYNAGLEDAGEQEACGRYVAIANMLGIAAGTDKATVHGLLRHIKNLMIKIKIPQQITDLKIDKDEYEQALREMAEKALADNCTLTNPRVPKIEEIEAIYKKLCKGGY